MSSFARIAGVILLRDVAERRAAEALLDLLADLLDEGVGLLLGGRMRLLCLVVIGAVVKTAPSFLLLRGQHGVCGSTGGGESVDALRLLRLGRA